MIYYTLYYVVNGVDVNGKNPVNNSWLFLWKMGKHSLILELGSDYAVIYCK